MRVVFFDTRLICAEDVYGLMYLVFLLFLAAFTFETFNPVLTHL